MQEYKSFDEQIEILQNRGLIIDNIEEAKQILRIHNYYNVVNGYKELFCYIDDEGNEKYKDGSTFEELYELYNFDRVLKSIVLQYTLQIENTLRTIVSHVFSKYHGVENYLRYSNFDFIEYSKASNKKVSDRAKHINELISNMQMDLAKATIKKDYINHYIVKHGYVPLWVLVNTISFSRLSTLYQLMKQSERIEVSKYWDIKEKDLSSYIELLAFFRNICAHDDRLYNAKCKKYISNTPIHEKLSIPKTDKGYYALGKNDIFALLIVSKILLPSSEFNTMFNKISGRLTSLSTKLKTISISDVYKQMGFPEYWYLIKKLS